MLIANEMLEMLQKGDIIQDYQDCNNDYDFSEVLEFCGDNTSQIHRLKYADGQEKEFSFNK